ncbi:MAG: hypothetical protein A3B68_05715 [Candidatus Melainabacteria bacterium RIFCSPHIGHO2_02_FULL_34_12]|nr:MAG: hypothetical protein A3B68_05715 [Candidatus Melainabacteria bacterium RIFCSPHIGHO2_02_FULL_34_12]
MKFSKLILNFILLFSLLLPLSYAQESNLNLRAPELIKESNESIPSKIEIKKLPVFPNTQIKKSTAKKISAVAALIPIDTRFRMVVDSPLDAKKSMLGDYFKAHVAEDFYLPTNPPQLIVPKGSWVRGKVSFLKRPSIFSMAGKIGLHLYQLTSPLGELTPLDAELNIQQGIVNKEGLLDPMTNFGTKALEPTQNLLESENPAARIVIIATLGTPAIGTLIGGSLIALFSQGDNITIPKGQELQIVLRKDIQLKLN